MGVLDTATRIKSGDANDELCDLNGYTAFTASSPRAAAMRRLV
jgi:hypothetical protein